MFITRKTMTFFVIEIKRKIKKNEENKKGKMRLRLREREDRELTPWHQLQLFPFAFFLPLFSDVFLDRRNLIF